MIEKEERLKYLSYAQWVSLVVVSLLLSIHQVKLVLVNSSSALNAVLDTYEQSAFRSPIITPRDVLKCAAAKLNAGRRELISAIASSGLVCDARTKKWGRSATWGSLCCSVTSRVRIMLVIYTLYKPPHVSSVHRIRTAYGGLSNKSSTSGSR